VGHTQTARYFTVDSYALLAVMNEGAVDTTETAADNVDFFRAHFSELGIRGGLVMFLDGGASQDPGARRLYASGSDPSVLSCFALVGSTLLARAIASFFLGLTRSRVPTAFFETLTEANPWIDALTVPARSVSGW
jgi:hypothetical protein